MEYYQDSLGNQYPPRPTNSVGISGNAPKSVNGAITVELEKIFKSLDGLTDAVQSHESRIQKILCSSAGSNPAGPTESQSSELHGLLQSVELRISALRDYVYNISSNVTL